MRRNHSAALSVGIAALAGLAILTRTQAQSGSAAPMPAMAPARTATKAIAVLQPTQGSSVRGTVTFTRVVSRVRVVAHIEGLAPGQHGFHIHEFGDASSPDGSSAGGHFNPTGAPHAGPKDMPRHVGDLGNITADASGQAHLDAFVSGLAFDGPNSILGRGVVVHANVDDLKSQPSGNAGGRLAVGVIGVAKP